MPRQGELSMRTAMTVVTLLAGRASQMYFTAQLARQTVRAPSFHLLPRRARIRVKFVPLPACMQLERLSSPVLPVSLTALEAR